MVDGPNGAAGGTFDGTVALTPCEQVTRIVLVLRENMPELQTRYGVKSLGVFGSHVRGEQMEGSDLDVLVEFHEAPSLFEFVRLEDQLGALLGIEVDLVMKDALKPRIGGHILEELVPV